MKREIYLTLGELLIRVRDLDRRHVLWQATRGMDGGYLLDLIE